MAIFFQKKSKIINQDCGHGSRTSQMEFQLEKFNIRFISRTIPLKDPNFLIKFIMLAMYFPAFGLGSNSALLTLILGSSSILLDANVKNLYLASLRFLSIKQTLFSKLLKSH